MRCSGEGAFDVTEKFSLDHCLWKRSAIELHHRLSSTPATGVNSVGNHFLAHAAFACNENVRIRGRHCLDQFLNFLHRLAFKNWGRSRFRDLQPLLQLLRLLPQFFSFPEQELFLQCFLHQAQKFLRRIRLADKMVRAAFDRLDGVMQRVVRRENDHLRFRQFGLDPIEHFQPMGVRQLQV